MSTMGKNYFKFLIFVAIIFIYSVFIDNCILNLNKFTVHLKISFKLTRLFIYCCYSFLLMVFKFKQHFLEMINYRQYIKLLILIISLVAILKMYKFTFLNKILLKLVYFLIFKKKLCN